MVFRREIFDFIWKVIKCMVIVRIIVIMLLKCSVFVVFERNLSRNKYFLRVRNSDLYFGEEYICWNKILR